MGLIDEAENGLLPLLADDGLLPRGLYDVTETGRTTVTAFKCVSWASLTMDDAFPIGVGGQLSPMLPIGDGLRPLLQPPPQSGE